MSHTSLNLEVPIDPQLIRDLIITAVEGGINYWAHTATYFNCDRKAGGMQAMDYSEFPLDGGYVEIVPDERIADDAPDRYKIDAVAVIRGLKTMQKKYPVHFGNLFTESGWDAETADVFVQCCCFDEIVFG